MRTTILVAVLALAACGAESPEAEEAGSDEAGVFDDLTGTLDRAEAVEQQVLEQKERLDRALDEAEAEDPESRRR